MAKLQKYGIATRIAPKRVMEVAIPAYDDEVLDRAGLPKCGLEDLFPVANR